MQISDTRNVQELTEVVNMIYSPQDGQVQSTHRLRGRWKDEEEHIYWETLKKQSYGKNATRYLGTVHGYCTRISRNVAMREQTALIAASRP